MDFKRSLGITGLVLGMQGCLYIEVEHKTKPPKLQDIDGDGKQDVVYCNRVVDDKSNTHYEVYFRRNLGEGKFDEPLLLMRSNIVPKDYCD